MDLMVKLKKKKEKFKFECSLCCECYDEINRRPLTLVPCGHTLCADCTFHLIRNECPFCRISFGKYYLFHSCKIIYPQNIRWLSLNSIRLMSLFQ